MFRPIEIQLVAVGQHLRDAKVLHSSQRRPGALGRGEAVQRAQELVVAENRRRRWRQGRRPREECDEQAAGTYVQQGRAVSDNLCQVLAVQGGLIQGLRFNVHTLFTYLVLTPLPGGVYLY